MRFIIQLTHRKWFQRNRFLFIILFDIVIGLLSILYLDSIKNLVNHLVEKENIVLYAGMIVVFALGNCFLKKACKLYSVRQRNGIEQNLKEGLFLKLNRIKMARIDHYTIGDIITRAEDDVEKIAEFCINTLSGFFENMLMLLLIVGYVAANNVYLLAFVAIAVPVIAFTKYFSRKSADIFKERQSRKVAVNALAKDIFGNGGVISACHAAAYFSGRYEEREREYLKIEKTRNLYDRLIWLVSVAGYQLIYLLFYVAGGLLSYYYHYSFGLIISLFFIIDPLIDMIQALPEAVNKAVQVKVNLARYDEIMDIAEPDTDAVDIETGDTAKDTETDDTAVDIGMSDTGEDIKADGSAHRRKKGKIAKPDATGTEHGGVDVIDMENICYTYRGSGGSGLKDIHLSLQSDENVVIIGRSGSGKSTLMRMVMGYDDTYSGSIRINQYELRRLDAGVVQTYIACLPQDITLCQGSVRDNISRLVADHPDASDIESAMKEALLTGELDVDTELSVGGKNVSGGQKQRIGILLSILKHTPFCFLDESISAVDHRMQLKLIKNLLLERTGGVVLITHDIRNELIGCFDRVIVMEDGRIIASGRTEEMLNSALYKHLQKEMERTEE